MEQIVFQLFGSFSQSLLIFISSWRTHEGRWEKVAFGCLCWTSLACLQMDHRFNTMNWTQINTYRTFLLVIIWNAMTNIHTFEMSNSVELASAHDATHRKAMNKWTHIPLRTVWCRHFATSERVIFFIDMLMMVWRATVAQAKLNSELPWCLLPT